jgi:hypothetical protein
MFMDSQFNKFDNIKLGCILTIMAPIDTLKAAGTTEIQWLQGEEVPRSAQLFNDIMNCRQRVFVVAQMTHDMADGTKIPNRSWDFSGRLKSLANRMTKKKTLEAWERTPVDDLEFHMGLSLTAVFQRFPDQVHNSEIFKAIGEMRGFMQQDSRDGLHSSWLVERREKRILDGLTYTWNKEEYEEDAYPEHKYCLFQTSNSYAELLNGEPHSQAEQLGDAHCQSLLMPYVREVLGNPFRPVEFNPAWRTFTTVALANQMYDSQDFSAMPILADALQDADCDNEDILNHCRGLQNHFRGCWVVEEVLGRR